MYDIILKNGFLIDGSGNPVIKDMDVAVKDGLIVKIGKNIKSADSVVDVQGLIVAPGFIDTHSHSDLFLIQDPDSKAKVHQGITTEIIGQDGLGEAPIRDDLVEDWRLYLSGLNGDPPIDWTWRSFGDYLDVIERSRPSVNVAGLVGHGNLRLLAMGMDDRDPTKIELNEMTVILKESLIQGALGLSTGLIYAPCIFSKKNELVELCKVTAQLGGVFVVHIRNEGEKLLESVDEVLEIGRTSGIHTHISHFKAQGETNWGKSKDSLKKLEKARSNGISVSFDQYPYTAGSTFLSSLIPSWAHKGGVDKLLERLEDPKIRFEIINEKTEMIKSGRSTNFDKILVTYLETEANKKFEGLSIKNISEKRGQNEIETLMDLILEEKNQASMVSFSMNEEDVERIMSHHLGMICTDGLLLGKPHPRAYGSFPRVIGSYVRKGVLKLEEAIRKMTSYPAQIFKLDKRGQLRLGYYADITVFNPHTIIDKATYQDPRRYPEGIEHVLVNGKFIIKNKEYTDKRNGKILKIINP
jgi:N-acyl-D-amino-acid deacylase